MGRVSLGDVDAATAESVAEAMQALSTPSRVRLLARLCEGACSVGGSLRALGWSSRSCRASCGCCGISGLVRRMRDGRHTMYELHNDHVAVLLAQAMHHVDHTRRADAAAAAANTARPIGA